MIDRTNAWFAVIDSPSKEILTVTSPPNIQTSRQRAEDYTSVSIKVAIGLKVGGRKVFRGKTHWSVIFEHIETQTWINKKVAALQQQTEAYSKTVPLKYSR